jgi:AraC-like DNA-binding protein
MVYVKDAPESLTILFIGLYLCFSAYPLPLALYLLPLLPFYIYNYRVMINSNSWTQLAQRHVKTPLAYVHGWCTPTCLGVCCAYHFHPEFEVVYHAEGHGITRTAHIPALPFSEGSVVIYPPGEKHDQVMDKPGEDLCFLINIPSGRGPVPKTSLYIPRIVSNPVIEDIRTLSRGPHRTKGLEQSAFDFRATSTFLSLIYMATVASDQEQAGTMEKHVLRAEQYIRDHAPTIKTVAEIAEAVGIGPDRLRHGFKSLRGTSLVHYLTKVRIDLAKTFLLHSELPLKQIASRCGFNDEYYFSAVFRRVAHMAPGRYRNNG